MTPYLAAWLDKPFDHFLPTGHGLFLCLLRMPALNVPQMGRRIEEAYQKWSE